MKEEFDEWGESNIPNKDTKLEGMQCPQCKHLGPFEIKVEGWATVDQNGVTRVPAVFGEDDGSSEWEWDEYSECACPECGYTAMVKHFELDIDDSDDDDEDEEDEEEKPEPPNP